MDAGNKPLLVALLNAQEALNLLTLVQEMFTIQ